MNVNGIWKTIQAGLSAIGAGIGFFLGGMDGLLIALIVFMALDYVTGVMCAIVAKTLSSDVGFKGIFKKVLILMLVGVANLIDVYVIGNGSAIRGAVIAFYLSNEGISILENAAQLDLPIPAKLKDILAQLHEENDDTTESDSNE